MRGCKLRRIKTLFLTIFSLTFCFVILLNLMVVQLNSSREHLDDTSEFSIQKKHTQDGNSLSSEELYLNSHSVKLIERKPQAMSEDSGKKIVYNPVQHITKQQKHNIEMDYKMSQMQKLDKSENYEYEEDIENAIIEDESESNEEDQNEDLDDNQDSVLDKNINFPKIKNSTFIRPKLKFQEVPNYVKPLTQSVQTTVPTTSLVVRNVVVDGIFWSDEVEQLIPKGLSFEQTSSWTDNVRHQPVQDLKLPTWNKCGRDKNRYVVLKDGTALCARYRHPLNKLVLGEVLSFYLSKLLQMDNIPTVVLSQLNQTSYQWNQHNLTAADWQPDQFVALIQWIPDMDTKESYVFMPSQILEGLESKSVVDVISLADDQLTPTVLSQLVQWGSMIIYDYLTANYDRVGSMQDGAFREKKPSILKEHIRNLRKTVKTSKLWLIDNESGLLDAYELMYKGGQNGKQFVTFHQQMLQTMCIFEKSLVKAIRSLHNTPEPYQTLVNFARQHEPLLDQIPIKDNTYSLFKTMFSKRLTDVYEWIQFCQSRQL